MKVGIFGYYQYGNFGDDLMAFLFHDFLRNQGHEVRVYGLNGQVAESAGIEVVRHVGDLVAWADCLVYGGGGILLGGEPNDLIKTDLDCLINAKMRKGIGLYAISIGGDRDSRYACLGSHQKRLLQASDFITFRNPEDRSLAEAAGVSQFQIHSDLVWRAGDGDGAGTVRDLVTLEFSGTRNRWLYVLAAALAGRLSRAQIKQVELKHATYQRRRMRSRIKRLLSSSIRYQTIAQMMALARRSRFIFTSRLHFGLAGLASGSTVFLVHPASKSRMLFERLGLDDFILDTRSQVFRVMHELAHRRMDRYAFGREQSAAIEAARRDSAGHFDTLRELLSTPVDE
jgi:polysaccharide pyruvyl transferase WcaK-like protein